MAALGMQLELGAESLALVNGQGERNVTTNYQGFVEAGILLMNPAQIEALTLNAWIIMTSWVRFLCTAGASPDNLSQDMLRRGIYQVLALEGGYIAPSARAAVEALYDRLHVPLEQVL
ncbi:hypothetical protein A4X13_0g8078 [Tilletia indica]|uniref:Uncharacterized protein n=1 Tax=Tilletia indica TaxID=43049 RepID=A0A8T8SH12_9BASI|nr:hypothetical protein A4X13_0g8078 [Tilletia indica]